MPRMTSAIIAGDALSTKSGIPIPKNVMPGFGIAEVMVVIVATTAKIQLAVTIHGIVHITNTGTITPTAVAKRIGIVQTRTRSMRLKTQRIATIHGTARNVIKGIYLRKPACRVIGSVKPAMPFIIPIAKTCPFRTTTPGTVISMRTTPVAK